MEEEEIIEHQIPKGKIYKENAIRTATFFSGSLVAGYMMANNFNVFNEPQKAKKAWIYSIIILILILGLAFIIPENANIPKYIIPIIFAWIAYYLVKHYQENNIAEHINSGGEYYKGWRIFVISLIGLVITFGPIFGIIYITNAATNEYGSLKTYGTIKNEIHYSKSNFSDAEIDKFAEGFKKFEVFSETTQMFAYIDKKDSTYVISFSFNDKIKGNKKAINWFIDLRVNMQTLFPNINIIINMVIDNLDNVYKRIDEKTRYM
jgi:hypothetical protein